MNQRKDLPPTTAVNFLERVKEELTVYMGNRGAPLEQAVRFQDLSDGNLVVLSPAFLAGRGGQGQPNIIAPGTAVTAPAAVDLTPPPTVTGFTALAAISNLLLSTDDPVFTVGHGYLQTVLYGVTRGPSDPLPTFSSAVELARFVGGVYAYPTNPATIWHLWVKWRSVDGVLSDAPAGGVNGVSVTTAVDVTRLIAALTGPGNPFKVVTTSYTLADGTVVPVGTYTSDAYMGSFVAARGQIGLLAVDDARIASLQVSKLKAGSISVGEYIQSTGFLSGSAGWRINGNGVAEFSGVIVRGTIYAASGQIGGNTIDGTGVYSSNYNAGVSGWKIFPDGTAEFAAASIRGQLVSAQISAGAITTDKITVGQVSAAQENNLVNYMAYPASTSTFFDYTNNLVTITTTGVPLFIWAVVQVLTESDAANVEHFYVSISVLIDGVPATTPGLNVVATKLFTETITVAGRRQGEAAISLAFRVPVAAGAHTLSIRHTVEPRQADRTATTFGSTGFVQLSSNLMCLENKV